MNNKNKTTTLKTLLMMNIIILMLMTSPIVNLQHAQAETGDILLKINNPTPETADIFGWPITDTPNGNILAGARYDNTGATSAGSAYLFDGNNGSLLLTLNNPTPEINDWFGISVASTINGNILVSASGDNTGATSAGSAYLFDGNDGSLLLTINNPTPESGEEFGTSVTGTINGNILVGAWADNTGASNAGSAYLFDGNDGSLLLTINNPTPEINDWFGTSVTGTINGNILVGAWGDNTGATSAGSAYLFDGNDGSLLLTLNNPTPEDNDQFGRSISGTTNGNILVGALEDDTVITDTGSAYLFDGNDGSLLLTLNNPTPERADYFGASISGTTNGNILVGAHDDNTGAFRAGSAYLFDGNDGSLLLTLNNPTPGPSYNFGVSVAGTTNGNILVGTLADYSGATSAGSVYLFEGISTTIPSPRIISLIADDPDDLDNVYSREDTITITFDSDTNTPGGEFVQRKPAVDDMFAFTESLGRAYSGKWIAPDTFVITIKSVNNAGPAVIGTTTVTPTGITPILSADETSDSSFVTSPILSGDFGIQ